MEALYIQGGFQIKGPGSWMRMNDHTEYYEHNEANTPHDSANTLHDTSVTPLLSNGSWSSKYLCTFRIGCIHYSPPISNRQISRKSRALFFTIRFIYILRIQEAIS